MANPFYPPPIQGPMVRAVLPNPRPRGLSNAYTPFPGNIGLPLLESLTYEIARNVQAPTALIFACALGAIATLAQGLINVRKGNGDIVPTSLFILTIADSGERKSTVDNILIGPIREFEETHDNESGEASESWKNELEIWELKRGSLKGSIRKLLTKEADTSIQEAKLRELQKAKPRKPKRFKLLYEDATSEALFHGLHKDLPTAGLITTDGEGVLRGRAFNDLSKQNSIWSGESITVDRASGESFRLGNARLSIVIQVQNKIFQEYMATKGALAQGSGLWARFLVCRPSSRVGTRLNQITTPSWTNRTKYNERLTELLDANLDLINNPKKDKEIIDFSTDARELWHEICDDIEISIPTRFVGAADHASKLAENIARVAALLHFFERFEGDISSLTLWKATQICSWFSDEYMAIFVPPPREVVDAESLYQWLLSHYIRLNQFSAEKNKVRQYGPNQLRDIKRLNSAIAELMRQGVVKECTFEGKQYLQFNLRPQPPLHPPLFPSPP